MNVYLTQILTRISPPTIYTKIQNGLYDFNYLQFHPYILLPSKRLQPKNIIKQKFPQTILLCY